MVLHYFILVDNLVHNCEKLNIPPFLHPPLHLYTSFPHPAALPVRHKYKIKSLSWIVPRKYAVLQCSTNPTLVEVGQGFFVQFHSRWCGRAEDVLKGWQFGIVLRRQLRFFLLEDRQCKDISATYNSRTFSYKDFTEYPSLHLHLILMLWDNGDSLWRNAELWWLKIKNSTCIM